MLASNVSILGYHMIFHSVRANFIHVHSLSPVLKRFMLILGKSLFVNWFLVFPVVCVCVHIYMYIIYI